MKKLLILAVVLRLLVAVFYFHPDIKTIYFQSSFLKQGVFNIYNYLIQNKQNLPLKEEFVYFPLAYFAVGGYHAIASSLLGGAFGSWLANAGSNSFIVDTSIFRYLFVMKLPFLILDIWIAFLLKKFFNDKKKGELAFKLWLFNPFTIFLIYAYSNIDIIAVLFTVLAFLYLKRERFLPAAVAFGLAAGFKLYPLLAIPFLFLYGKNLRQKLTLSLVPLAIFFLICLPFLSSSFIHSALISGLSTGLFKSEFTTLGLAILFFYAAFKDKSLDVFNYWLVIFLIIFSFALFHIQWLLWIAPFLVIIAVKRPKLSYLILIISVFAFSVPILYQDRFMTLGLLRAYSTLFDLLPTPFVVVQTIYDPYNLQSILHSIFAGGSLVLSYLLLRRESS